MPNRIMLSCLLVLLIAISAQAEHKLLITDTLDARQSEAALNFNYAHSSYELPRAAYMSEGSTSRIAYSSLVSLGLGLGYGLQLTASIPYVFYDKTRSTQDNMLIPGDSGRYSKEHSGFGDATIGAKYRIWGNEKQTWALTTGLDLKLDSADSHYVGSGTTDISPFIATSTVVNTNLRPYGWYRAVIRDHSRGESHLIGIGAEYELNRTLTLKPSFSMELNISSNTFKPYGTYHADLTSYLQLHRNLYLLPALTLAYSPLIDLKQYKERYQDLTTRSISLALYYYFQ